MRVHYTRGFFVGLSGPSIYLCVQLDDRRYGHGTIGSLSKVVLYLVNRCEPKSHCIATFLWEITYDLQYFVLKVLNCFICMYSKIPTIFKK